MAASLPRPIRMGASASSARSPLLAPSTTSTWVGAPLRAFCLGCRRGFGAAASRAVCGTRAPNMSERITEIADSPKIQRIARHEALIRKRVSSAIGPLLDHPYGQRGAADPDLRAVLDRRAGHPVAVDEHPVGGPQVVDGHGHARSRLLHGELDVAAAHPGVVDAQVRLGAAADHETR